MTAKSKKPELSGADPAAVRDAIMDAAISHVPFDGWGREAAIRGAEDIGLDAAAAMRASAASTAFSACAENRRAAGTAADGEGGGAPGTRRRCRPLPLGGCW